MFDFPLPSMARAAALGLLTVWALLLFGGLVFGQPGPDRRNRLPRPLRMALSVLLLLLALLLWLQGAASTRLASFGLLVAVGMALGLLGDLFMAGLLVPKPNHVIFGMLAFGLGHVAYIVAFHQASAAIGLGSGPVWVWSLGLCLLLGGALWLALVRTPARGATLNLGTFVYSLLLALMAGSGFAVALQTQGFGGLALGVTLFMVSDLVLGNELMRHTHFPSIGDVIWVSYTVAQMLIVISVPAALRLIV